MPCHQLEQAARAAAAPAGTQQLEAAQQRLEAKLKERTEYAQQLESRLAESENHKQTLREAVDVSACLVDAWLLLLLCPCSVSMCCQWLLVHAETAQ